MIHTGDSGGNPLIVMSAVDERVEISRLAGRDPKMKYLQKLTRARMELLRDMPLPALHPGCRFQSRYGGDDIFVIVIP